MNLVFLVLLLLFDLILLFSVCVARLRVVDRLVFCVLAVLLVVNFGLLGWSLVLVLKRVAIVCLVLDLVSWWFLGFGSVFGVYFWTSMGREFLWGLLVLVISWFRF